MEDDNKKIINKTTLLNFVCFNLKIFISLTLQTSNQAFITEDKQPKLRYNKEEPNN